ncbi:type 2 isopentenyl-diphosphate Delta-isomerase [Soehngenia saccharolytica]|nr:type 2 isopentenyl-diphosphate Delta-isomerase [Soehngenia saccharolytica]
MRKARKKEHVENYLRTSFKGDTLLGDVYLPHNALPELNFDDINTSLVFLNKKINYPVLINAMTGGSDFSEGINRDLSTIAREFNIPMAVGSETIVLEDKEAENSFRVVRDIIGDEGIVIGNIGGLSSSEDAKLAVDILKADALQIHLNVAQELVMDEGDRDFKGVLKNIESIVKSVEVPIIVKEVGFGISYDVAKKLYDVGVRHIDVSGFGGTNFIEIENLRNPSMDFTELYSWGIPTAASIIQVRKLPDDLRIIASGGIRTSMDIIKSIVLGADVAGISGEILSYLVHGGISNAMEYMENTIYKLKVIMMLLGKKDLQELREVDYKVTGKLKEII